MGETNLFEVSNQLNQLFDALETLHVGTVSVKLYKCNKNMHKNSPLQMFSWKYNTLNAIQLPLNSEVSNVFLRFIIHLQGLFCLVYEKHV